MLSSIDILMLFVPPLSDCWKDLTVNSCMAVWLGREQILNAADLQIIQAALPASVAVCGMAYAMQAQLCSNILNASADPAYSMSFYDSFSLWSNTSTAATYFTNPTPEAVQNVMVSAGAQRDSLMSPPDEVSPACTVTLTGNPTLESWAEVDADEERKAVTRRVLYGADQSDTVGIVYAGNLYVLHCGLKHGINFIVHHNNRRLWWRRLHEFA
jgi:hypothetical protein